MALRPRFGDARRRLEIHIGDAHADLNLVSAETLYLLVPFDGVRSDTVIRGVEIERAARRFGGATGSRGRYRGTRPNGAGERRESRAPQERSSIQPLFL